jgi:hypothetical protein
MAECPFPDILSTSCAGLNFHLKTFDSEPCYYQFSSQSFSQPSLTTGISNPAKFPTVKEWSEALNISPACASCRVPPLGPLDGGSDNIYGRNCSGYTMKQWRGPGWNVEDFKNCVGTGLNLNQNCFWSHCSEPDQFRLIQLTCRDKWDPLYNAYAHMLKYCIGVLGNATTVLGENLDIFVKWCFFLDFLNFR